MRDLIHNFFINEDIDFYRIGEDFDDIDVPCMVDTFLEENGTTEITRERWMEVFSLCEEWAKNNGWM